MNVVRGIGTATAVALLGTAFSLYAEQREGEKQGEKHGDKQAEQRKPEGQKGGRAIGAQPRHRGASEAQGQSRQPESQRQQQKSQPEQVQRPDQPRMQQRPEQFGKQTQAPRAQQQAQPSRTQPQARAWQLRQGWSGQGGWARHDIWQQSRAQHWSSDHRGWAQRGGYGGYYIPQDRFSLHFGSGHFFRIGSRPVMYMGYPRFEYGGFSFLLVDPYPENWPQDWYASDDVYIDYDDGYYLYDPTYPFVRLAVTITL